MRSIFTLSDIDENADWEIYIHRSSWNEKHITKKLKYIQEDPSIGSRVLSKDLQYGTIIVALKDTQTIIKTEPLYLKKSNN